jgi:cytochrome d ubiquinol oxidase subunit I
MVAQYQPVTLAAMEGKFNGSSRAGIAVIGQPNVAARRLDNTIGFPDALSFLAYGTFASYVHGLDEYPQSIWPDNIELLYYAYHLVIRTGGMFIGLMAFAAFLNWRKRLISTTWLLWIILLAFPFPYIANRLGWMTAELGRQPWLLYNIFRTSEGYSEGYSKVVHNGDATFTLIGFVGLYFVLGLAFLYLTAREIVRGPDGQPAKASAEANSLTAIPAGKTLA